MRELNKLVAIAKATFTGGQKQLRNNHRSLPHDEILEEMKQSAGQKVKIHGEQEIQNKISKLRKYP